MTYVENLKLIGLRKIYLSYQDFSMNNLRRSRSSCLHSRTLIALISLIPVTNTYIGKLYTFRQHVIG